MRGRPTGREVPDGRERGSFGQLTLAVLAAVIGLMTVVPASGMVAPAGPAQAGPSPASDVVTLLRLANGPRVMPPLLRQPPLAAFAVRPPPAISLGPALPPIPVLPPIPAVPPVPAVPDEWMIGTTALPGTSVWAAIAFAMAQRGLPYVWGGDGPQRGEVGFDCSGLTTAAYAYAGVILPRTAHTQFYAGPHVAAGAPLLPGDLVFYGVPERVHHVGLYLGYGRMVNAPTFGQPVQLAWVRYPGDDYLGATRPGAGRNGPGLLPRPDLPREVPPVPAPEVPPGPTEFPAPPAPDPPPPASTTTTTTTTATTTAGERAPAEPEPGRGGLTSATLGSAPSSPEGSTTTTREASPTGTTGPTPAHTSAAPSSTTETTTAPPSPPSTTTNPTAKAAPTPDTAPTSGTAPTRSPTPSSTSAAANSGTSAKAAPTGPSTTASEPTTTTTTTTTAPSRPAGAPAAPGDRLTLPGDRKLRLVRVEPGPHGLPAAPADPGAAGLTDGRAVTLPPGEPDGELVAGAALQVDRDGKPVTLTVTSRRTVDAATAQGIATADPNRLVLLRTDGEGSVLVVVAQ